MQNTDNSIATARMNGRINAMTMLNPNHQARAQRRADPVEADSDSSSEVCDPENAGLIEDVDSSSVLKSSQTIASSPSRRVEEELPVLEYPSSNQHTAEVANRRMPPPPSSPSSLLFLPGMGIIRPPLFGNSIPNLNGLNMNEEEAIQSKTNVGLDEDKASARRLPRSPWLSFPDLFRILRTKISSTNWKKLLKVYIEFKAGKVHRAFLIKRMRSIVGDYILYQCIRSMHRPGY